MNTITDKLKYELNFLFVLIYCLSSIQFFKPVLISSSLSYSIYYFAFFLSILIVVLRYKISYYNSITFPILLILISQILSIFSSVYSWNQNLSDSIKATLPYMGYVLFFLLLVLRIKSSNAEKLIIILGCLYIILYLISFLIYPKIIIIFSETYTDERGFQRIIINGFGFLFLFSFFSLNKYLTRYNFLWLIVYIITCAFVVMTLTRTLITVSFILSLLYLLRKANAFHKIIAILIFGSSFYILPNFEFYKSLVAETTSETAYIKDNIRLQAFNYYINDFSPNPVAKLFGNGQPYKDTEYAKYVNYLEKGLGLYASDIGYAGFYVKFGVLAILAYVILIYQIIRIKVVDDYLYCKYFLYFTFIISLIIEAPFNSSFIISIMIACYILSINAKQNLLPNVSVRKYKIA